MRRREFITLLGGAAAWPLAARSKQAERMRRIGVLMGYPEGDVQAQANVTALLQGLQSLGWLEGRNIQIDYRWAGGDPGSHFCQRADRHDARRHGAQYESSDTDPAA